MSIKQKILNCLDKVGFHGAEVLRIMPERTTENEYLLIFQGIDNRIRKCIIIGNEADNRFDFKYSIE